MEPGSVVARMASCKVVFERYVVPSPPTHNTCTPIQFVEEIVHVGYHLQAFGIVQRAKGRWHKRQGVLLLLLCYVCCCLRPSAVFASHLPSTASPCKLYAVSDLMLFDLQSTLFLALGVCLQARSSLFVSAVLCLLMNSLSSYTFF